MKIKKNEDIKILNLCHKTAKKNFFSFSILFFGKFFFILSFIPFNWNVRKFYSVQHNVFV